MGIRAFVSLYSSLSANEKLEFSKFIQSPFFNENKNLIKLNSIIRDFPSEVLCNIDTDKLIFDAYSNYKLSDEMIRRVCSDFNSLLKKFFIQKEIDKNILSKKYFLLKSYRKRYLDGFYESELYKTKSLLAEKKFRNREYYNDRVRISLEEFLFNYLRRNTQKAEQSSRESEKLIELMNHSINLIVFINSAIVTPSFIPNIKLTKNIEKVLKLIESDIDYFRESEPNIYTYYLLSKVLLSSEEETLLRKLLSYLNDNFDNFNDTVSESVLLTLFKFCISKINHGKNKFTLFAYEVLMIMKNNKLFDGMREIPDETFFGGVIISLFNEDIEYAEYFLENYYSKLNPVSKNEIVRITRAMIYFKQSHYDKAKNLLNNLKTHDLTNYFFARTTLLKIFYEKKEYDYIYPLTDTIRHFVKRKPEVNERMNQSINKFLEYLLKLSKIRQNNGKNIDKVIYHLEKENHFFQKSWLLEKAEEILKPLEV